MYIVLYSCYFCITIIWVIFHWTPHINGKRKQKQMCRHQGIVVAWRCSVKSYFDKCCKFIWIAKFFRNTFCRTSIIENTGFCLISIFPLMSWIVKGFHFRKALHFRRLTWFWIRLFGYVSVYSGIQLI